MTDLIKEWWAIAVAALGMFIGFKSGQERNKWRIDGLEAHVARLNTEIRSHEIKVEKELKNLTENRSADAVTLGVIKVTLEQLRHTLDEINKKLEHKVDK